MRLLLTLDSRSARHLKPPAGQVFTGCNIENASLGLTVCAERVALWKALSEGEREFTRIAVISDADTPATPCGACRQLLWEYCGDIPVHASCRQWNKPHGPAGGLASSAFRQRLLLDGQSD